MGNVSKYNITYSLVKNVCAADQLTFIEYKRKPALICLVASCAIRIRTRSCLDMLENADAFFVGMLLIKVLEEFILDTLKKLIISYNVATSSITIYTRNIPSILNICKHYL